LLHVTIVIVRVVHLGRCLRTIRIRDVHGRWAIDVARVRFVMSGLPQVAIHLDGRKRLNRAAQHEQDGEEEFAQNIVLESSTRV
jgi:hypothetical protein